MSQGFDALQSHATRLRGAPLSDLLAREPDRVDTHAVRSGPLYFNFARQSYDASAWQALVEHARQADLAAAFRRLFDGEKVNVTEDRAALHTALRGRHSDTAVAREAHESALQVRGRMADRAAAALSVLPWFLYYDGAVQLDAIVLYGAVYAMCGLLGEGAGVLTRKLLQGRTRSAAARAS